MGINSRDREAALRRLIGYACSVAGVAVLTLAVGFVHARVDIPNLSLVYLLLVLWLGARFGIGPAVLASILAFLAYDYFFVPPAGTLSVSAVRQLLGLILLLAAALVTGHLASSARRTGELATHAAEESRTLYELATAALKVPEVQAALELVAARARELGAVKDFGILMLLPGREELVAGGRLPENARGEARWAFEHATAIGIQLEHGEARFTTTRPARVQDAFLPLTNGVVWVRRDDGAAGSSNQAMLGALVSLAGLLVDRWAAQEEAERLRALEASDRLKGGILSSISHELKTPLAVLRTGLTSLGMPSSGLNSEHQALVAGLDHQAARLDRLVGDLLAMSRLEAGEPVRLEARDFGEVVGAVLQRSAPQLAGLVVTTELDPELPLVLMDELQIDRVLTNLVDNAADWTRPGGTIRVGAKASDGQLVAWVENDGPPIAPGDLESIFEKFWTKRASGTGLGLAIAKRIVEAHGGRIRARNLRSGPHFEFSLPLVPLEARL